MTLAQKPKKMLRLSTWPTTWPYQSRNSREIQLAASKDETLKEVMKIILEGWPAKKENLQARLHPYFHIRDELATQDGIVFKGPRAIIPEHLRKKIRERLHVAHTGIQSCL